jgi:hypothetical protein
MIDADGDAIIDEQVYYANTLHGNKFGFGKDATRTSI